MGHPSDRSSHAAPAPQPTLIAAVREFLRVKHYSLRTEQSYVGWIRRFIRFHGRRHPREMGAADVEAAAKGDIRCSGLESRPFRFRHRR